MEFPLNPKSIGIPLAYQVTPYQDVWHKLSGPEIWKQLPFLNHKLLESSSDSTIHTASRRGFSEQLPMPWP
jgi:hypothetical protein